MVGQPAGHQRQQLRLRHPGDVGSDDDRRFRLPHEDVGRRRQCLGPARAHQRHHDAGQQPHRRLQDAQVIEHGEDRRREDDDREGGEGEHEPVGKPFAHGDRIGEDPEDELRADAGELQEPRDDGSERGEQGVAGSHPADGELQNQDRQEDLEPDAPGDGAPADGGHVGRAGHGRQDERRDPHQGARSSGQPRQKRECRQREQDGHEGRAGAHSPVLVHHLGKPPQQPRPRRGVGGRLVY